MVNYIVIKSERKMSSMSDKQIETVRIGDSNLSPDLEDTPLRPILCLKNRDEIKKFEEEEDCFILEFDPYDVLDMSKASLTDDVDHAEADLCIIAEKGQVACRDFPHPRHTCAKYPFEKTPHDNHCKLCYCYVCDLVAPCSKWAGSAGHCHASNKEAWNNEKGQGTPLRSILCLTNRDEIKKYEEEEDCFILEFDPYDDLDMSKASLTDDFDNAEADLCITAEKGKVACKDYPHPRHTCAKYPFEKTLHDSHCKLCYCYVCDLAAPCSKWAWPSGHCHAFNNEAWNNEKNLRKNLVKTVEL
ncbi:hypothetical protein BUALT_Bualt06G0139100 [Buddleja alternifolia]|uniref:Uncharacterized protein n=1 Tax=Buddleja alternifolia TaxID=168488 RepID=A0AAV6XMX9_9LAMI|nr:hypothetical protein BUALT_Bualt06G0139100 [Buddleja alternifolia]